MRRRRPRRCRGGRPRSARRSRRSCPGRWRRRCSLPQSSVPSGGRCRRRSRAGRAGAPQAPQLPGSSLALTHTPSQRGPRPHRTPLAGPWRLAAARRRRRRRRTRGRGGPHRRAWCPRGMRRGLSQSCPGRQRTPHPPQWLALVSGTTHAPSQTISPSAHVAEQSPSRQSSLVAGARRSRSSGCRRRCRCTHRRSA